MTLHSRKLTSMQVNKVNLLIINITISLIKNHKILIEVQGDSRCLINSYYITEANKIKLYIR
jgi:hypothetical protein